MASKKVLKILKIVLLVLIGIKIIQTFFAFIQAPFTTEFLMSATLLILLILYTIGFWFILKRKKNGSTFIWIAVVLELIFYAYVFPLILQGRIHLGNLLLYLFPVIIGVLSYLYNKINKSL